LLAEVTSTFNTTSECDLSADSLLEVIDNKGIHLSAAPSVKSAELFLEAVVLHDNKINAFGG
jgi:hypothetical protein